MKLTTLILIMTIMQVSANSFAQKITLSEKNVPLVKLLKKIRTQSGYDFLFKTEILRNTRPISIHVKNAELKDVLDKILKDQSLDYDIKEQSVTLTRKAPSFLDRMISVFSSINISGLVTDENGSPLPGASVKVKGVNKVTVTNSMGEFSLQNVEENATLEVSYLGYTAQTIKVAKQSIIRIQLVQQSNLLDETLIQAYGTTSKRKNTGNISKVSAEQIATQPVNNLLSALQGKVPGLLITQSSGLPGATFKVQLRGRTAIDPNITDDQPLFLIDGVPMPFNNSAMNQIPSATQDGGVSPFGTLNPSEIESVEVLKDADATAIYGSRGANGVILITTKKGKAGKTKVNASVYQGFSEVSSSISLLNTQQYVQMRKTALANDNLAVDAVNSYDLASWDTTRYTNFPKLLSGNTAKNTNAQLSLSGGTELTQFRLSGGYSRETGVLPEALATTNTSVSFNISNSSPNKKFTTVFSGSYNSNNSNAVGAILTPYYLLAPNYKVYNDDGSLAWDEEQSGSTRVNPMAYAKQSRKGLNSQLQGNLNLSYKLLKNLVLSGNFGYTNVITDEESNVPITSLSPNSTAGRSSRFANGKRMTWNAEPQLNYNTHINKGKLNVLLGGTLQSIAGGSSVISASGYSNDNLLHSYIGATITGTKYSSQYKYEAIFGRINYDWESKYILNFTTRRDGSSKFGPNQRFANFFATGAAWIFTNENYFKDHLSFLSFGKLRGSYGTSGNDKIADYQYLDNWAPLTYTYNGSVALYPDKLFNPDYRWEKTTKREGAIELGFLKDKIFFTAAYYDHRSSNQLVNYKLPFATGFTSVVANLPALVKNSGLELELTGKPVNSKSFGWNISANLTIPKNKLVSFPTLAGSSYYATYVEGQSLNLIYTYKYTGVDPQTGLSTFEDVNKDGGLDYRDYQVVGTKDPKFYGGLSNDFRYKNFQFNVSFSFRKQMNQNYLYSILQPGAIAQNLPADMTGFWTKAGDEGASFQRLSQNGSLEQSAWSRLVTSDRAYSDASFIRLNNVNLAYNFSNQLMKRIHFNNLQVYVRAQNLFTITHYEGIDPETGGLNVPPLRTIVAGLQLTF